MRGLMNSTRLDMTRLAPGAPLFPMDSLYGQFASLVDYTVFSPSTAAYASLTSTGRIEVLEDDRLKGLLADFFGYFGDVPTDPRRVR